MGSTVKKVMHYRQGDVLLVRRTRLPRGTKPVPRDRGRIVLAYGEVTGHAHAIDEEFAELVEVEKQRFLRVPGKEVATLVHEEHAAIEVPPGIYEVRQQREYSPEEIRNVAD
jgi:hypothetical protein